MEMTELEKIEQCYEEVKEEGRQFDIDTSIKYNYYFYHNVLSELLEKEYTSEDKVKQMICVASTFNLKAISEELAQKYIKINIERLNNILVKTKIFEDDVLKLDSNIVNVYFDTEMMMDNMTYEDQSICAFLRFIKRFGFNLMPCNEQHRFIFTSFSTDNLVEQNYKCDTFYDFMEHYSPTILRQITKNILDAVLYSNNAVNLYPIENFNPKIVNSLNVAHAYKYLYNIEYARLNFCLENLWLPLRYKDISILKDENTMENLRKQLCIC